MGEKNINFAAVTCCKTCVLQYIYVDPYLFQKLRLTDTQMRKRKYKSSIGYQFRTSLLLHFCTLCVPGFRMGKKRSYSSAKVKLKTILL